MLGLLDYCMVEGFTLVNGLSFTFLTHAALFFLGLFFFFSGMVIHS